MATVLTPNNSGKTLETASEPGKINIKLDLGTFQVAPDGTVSLISGASGNLIQSGGGYALPYRNTDPTNYGTVGSQAVDLGFAPSGSGGPPGVFGATGVRSVISGGQNNLASGTGSVVVGGNGNVASGDYSFVGGGVRCDPTSKFGFGLEDLTLDAIIYANANVISGALTDFRMDGGEPFTMFISSSSGGRLAVWHGDTIGATGSPVPTEQWCHLSVTREAGTWRGFIDGVKQWTVTRSVNVAGLRPCGVGVA